MSYPALSKSVRNSRHLLLGAATIALTVAAMSQTVAAQSFQGTADVVQGGATVFTAPSSTTVNVNAPVTVIDWRPTETTGTGTIAFQPVGTTALFQSADFANFTVLNRILPVDANGAPVITRAIRFDGTVNSKFGFGSGVTAGSIWFYTPGGIILGSSAAFNVGSLVLSTSNIRSSSVFVGNTGTINFTGTPNPASAITLENGAQVSALLNGSSYVALIAPRIVQNGSIKVDGSAALVAAEAVDITMDGGTGLFDIAVSTGTGDANGIVHGATGSTTGPASAGAGVRQRIYMMAIPKNAAISMLVNGNIGYTPAATATVQNGEVILSAGYNITNGNVNLGEHATPVNNAQANITIGETSNLSTSFTSRVIARASGNLRASPGTSVRGPALGSFSGSTFLSFSGSAFLFGDLSSVVETNNANGFISVGGDLFVYSRRVGQGGNAAVRVLGGLLGVGGDLTIDANRVTMAGSLASNNIAIRARDGVAFTGPVSVVATNNLLISVLNGPIDLTGAITLRGDNSLSLFAGVGAITAPNTALVSNGNIGLFANGLSLGSVDTGGVLNTINSDGSVATAGSFVTPGNVSIAGQLAVRGGAASINSGGAITTVSILTTTGNDVLLTSTGAQSLGTVNSGRDVVANAASLTAFSVTAQRNVNAVVSGNLTLGTTRGALVDLRAGQDAIFNSSIIATNAVDVRVNGLATFRSIVNASNITVRSGNLAIESEGQIGVVGTTQNVTLNNSAGAQMTVGGSGVSAGYSLSNAEVVRIFGNNIDIGWTANLAMTGVAAPPPTSGVSQPSVIVDALTLTSRANNQSGSLATNGILSITTPGAMQVIGAVALNGAGTGNGIRLNAGQSLQIIAGQGSIAVRDGTTGLTGLIDLTSADIIAASSLAMTDIAAQTDPASINTRLGRNDGATNDMGILSADRVTLNGGNSIFVQNTGAGTAFDDRRGITANAINVRLTNANGLVVINGQITAAPGFATGLAAIPLLSVNGTPSQTATGFNALSTMNGCQITATASCSRQPENPASISVTTDDINRPLDPDQGLGADFPTSSIELTKFETFGYPPLIDEPVTGSGNDDLWPATCPADDETCKAASTTPVGN